MLSSSIKDGINYSLIISQQSLLFLFKIFIIFFLIKCFTKIPNGVQNHLNKQIFFGSVKH